MVRNYLETETTITNTTTITTTTSPSVVVIVMKDRITTIIIMIVRSTMLVVLAEEYGFRVGVLGLFHFNGWSVGEASERQEVEFPVLIRSSPAASLLISTEARRTASIQ